MLAVAADQVVRQARLELEQELGPLDDLPWFVRGRVPDGKAADVTVADDGGRRALIEAAERDRGDAHVALAGQDDAAAELDHAVIADVDAVVIVAGPTPDLQVVARLKSSVHATRR